MKSAAPNSIYGPVKSWRLGLSLGVDVLCVDSICSFECVYCQLGKINRVTTGRKVFVSTEKILRDLEKADWQKADVITFSGSGEPTLAKNLGEVICRIKEITKKPVVVLTNSSLLHCAAVRKEVALADKIFCKLDAWSAESLRRFDRPHGDVSLEKIISGIALLSREFKGWLAIQTMILRSLKRDEIEKFSKILRFINPAEVQLNLPARPVPREYFVEARGNEMKYNGSFTQLRTIPKTELEKLRRKLAEMTDLPVIAR